MDSEKELTMTDMQRSFWFLSTLNTDSPDNIIRFSISLKGSLTPEKLANALNEVIDGNRYLKVTFRDRGGQPQMEAADGRVAPVPFLKVSGEAPLSDSISGFIADTARIPPGEFPLFRHRAFSVDDGEWVVLFAFHHIIFDGPSIPLFAEQLLNAVAGSAAVPGEHRFLEELPRPGTAGPPGAGLERRSRQRRVQHEPGRKRNGRVLKDGGRTGYHRIFLLPAPLLAEHFAVFRPERVQHPHPCIHAVFAGIRQVHRLHDKFGPGSGSQGGRRQPVRLRRPFS